MNNNNHPPKQKQEISTIRRAKMSISLPKLQKEELGRAQGGCPHPQYGGCWTY